jgi:sporulation protein YlmC with PRC-barrel domain
MSDSDCSLPPASTSARFASNGDSSGRSRPDRPDPAGSQPRHGGNQAMNQSVISSERVEGTSVYNNAGDKLGSIDDLMIDKVSGKVQYAVMEFGGFLGMGTDRYPIPWSMLKYDTSLDGYRVPIDKTKLEAAPKYPEDRIPDYDVTYTGRINDYYGMQ